MGAVGVAGRRRRRVGRALGLLAALALGAGAGLAWAWPRLFPDPLAEARAAYGRHDWKAAVALSQRALKERPGDRGALQLMARADARLGRVEAAQAIYER